MSIQSLASSLQRKIRSDFPLSSLSESKFNVESFLTSCFGNRSKDPLDIANSLKRDLESYLDSTEKSLSLHVTQDFDKLLGIPSLMIEIENEIDSFYKESLTTKNTFQMILGHSEEVVSGIEKKISEIEESQKEKEKLIEKEEIQVVINEFNEKWETAKKVIEKKPVVSFAAIFERLAGLVKKFSDFKYSKSSELVKKKAEFLSVLQKLVISSYEDEENFEGLLSCYEVLGLETEVQLYLRDSVVYPVIKSFIPDQNVLSDDSFDIEAFYKNCKTELFEGRLRSFFLNKDSCGILLKSFWKGIWKTLLTKPKLFSPIFSNDYIKSLTTSTLFLTELCQSTQFGKTFLSGPDYTEFIEKWNLPTFYELKKTEILKPLLPLLKSEDLNNFSKQGPGKIFSEALTSCSANIILPELYPKFLRLYFQISSSYCNFVTRKLNSQLKSKGTSKDELLEVLQDVSSLKQLVEQSSFNADIKDEIKSSFQQIIDPCLRALIEILTKQCLSSIDNLKTIPSMYRMTGRAMPNSPSSFIHQILNPVKSISLDLIPREKIITKVVLTFIDTSQEVRQEIQKVGDLIIKYNPDSQDSEKMKKQLEIDTQEFRTQLENLGYTSENNEAIKHLT